MGSTAERMANLIANALDEDEMYQAELARLTGFSTKHVSQVLNNRVPAKLVTLDLWADALNREWVVTLRKK